MSKQASFLIDCPDSYLDILAVFFIFLEKNFEDKDYTFFITTESKEIPVPKGFDIRFVKCGFGYNSLERASICLKQISVPFIIVVDCDCFFSKKIDCDLLDKLLDIIVQKKLSYVRLWQTKNKEQRKYQADYPNLYYCNYKARYSKSLMANIWKKESFQTDVINLNMDGWSIEDKWLKDSFFGEKGYCDKYCYYDLDIFNILHGIYKGKWIRGAYRKIIRFDIDPKMLSFRNRVSKKESIKIFLSNFTYKHFSSRTILKMKKIFSRKIKFKSEY